MVGAFVYSWPRSEYSLLVRLKLDRTHFSRNVKLVTAKNLISTHVHVPSRLLPLLLA